MLFLFFSSAAVHLGVLVHGSPHTRRSQQRQNGFGRRWRQLNIIYGQSKKIRFGELHVLNRAKRFLYDKCACFKR